MAISDRIQSIEEHIKESYQELEGIGIDTTEVNKNLENIPKLIDGYWETLPKVTGEGTSITLDNTKEGKMKINLKGNTSQETTTQSKNLLPNTATTQTINDLTFTVNNDKSISISGTPNATTTFSINTSNIKLPAGTYTMSTQKEGTTSGNAYINVRLADESANVTTINLRIASSSTFTLEQETELYVRVYSSSNITFTNFKIYPMIESGSTATDYVEFVPNSPSPDYPQDIHVVSGDNSIDVCGKNLYDGLYTAKKYISYATGTVQNSDDWSASDFIPIQGNTNYILSGITNSGWVAGTSFYDNNKTFISSVYSTEYSFTTPANAKYLRFSMNSETPTNVMLEKGSTATTYEPYQSASYPINLGVENLINLDRTQGTYSGNGTTFEEGKYYPNMVRDSGNVGSNCEMISYTSGVLTIKGRYQMGVGYPIKCKPNQDYYIKTTSENSNARMFVSFYDSTGTYISGSPNNADLERQVTSPNNAYWIIPIFAVYGSSLVSVPFSDIKVLVGTKEQYISTTPIELCKIGDYQDSIKKSTGKNLFDKDNANMIEGYLNYSGNTVNTSNSTRTIYIPCKTNTTYTVSKIASSRFVIGTTSTIPANNVALIDKSQNNTATKLTLTTSPTAKYLCVFFYHSTYDTSITIQQILNSIMIEEGNITTPVYEPYGKVWYLSKQIGKVVLDGSENWGYESSYPRFYSGNATPNASQQATRTQIYSNYYKYLPSGSTAGGGFTYYGNLYLYNSNITTVADFKTWLGTAKPIIYYILETPTSTEITDSTLINQLEAINGAKSYTTQTNINQVNNDNASILNATALSE